jgi:hypothetical protein
VRQHAYPPPKPISYVGIDEGKAIGRCRKSAFGALIRYIERAIRASLVNGRLQLCGGDMTHSPICWRKRQWVPNLESTARYCDTRATYCMSHAHGTYVPSCMVEAANRAYVFRNNNKKMGSAYGVVESQKGR